VRSGARSTLGTLWPVNDEAAAELVGRFYRELARPGGSRAAALRSAQLAALAEPSLEHPAYWSPFVMIGSWQ
jgi:CHAT domain-containing protein